MSSIKDLWPDKWLKAEHLGRRSVTATIAGATVEELFNPAPGKRRLEHKLIVAFEGKKLRLICNKTQALSIARLTGELDYTKWKGAQVVLSEAIAPNGQPTIQVTAVPVESAN
jgi:hypothetical protein